MVVLWNQALLQGVRESKLGPPMVSRALAVAHTCAYDAWAMYDRVATATQVGGALRQPAAEHTLANKNKAISFATYRAAVDLFPGSKAGVFDPLMAQLGYDPADTAGAAGVGISCAQAVIDFRHDDQSNQLAGYADTTGYAPVNERMDQRFYCWDRSFLARSLVRSNRDSAGPARVLAVADSTPGWGWVGAMVSTALTTAVMARSCAAGTSRRR